MPIYAPIITHGLLLFYKNCNVYRIVYMFVSAELLVSIASQSFFSLYLRVSEIAKCIACGYLYKNYNVYRIVCVIRVIASRSFFSLYLQVSEIAKCIA